MITASSVNNKIVISVKDDKITRRRIERKKYGDDFYTVYTAAGFMLLPENPDIVAPETQENTENPDTLPIDLDTDGGEENGNGNAEIQENTENEQVTPEVLPKCVIVNDILDVDVQDATLYSYRYCDFDIENPQESDYVYSNWVKNGGASAIGYTFGNYIVPTGKWGAIVTEDDIRYTYLWGTDFKATNGASYSDEQIKYFIDAATEEIARELDITIVKKRIRSRAEENNLEKTEYDVDESLYDFRYSRISRYGVIKTRQRPILRLHSLKLLSRLENVKELKQTTIVDKTKGLLKLMTRPMRPSETASGISTAIGVYGNETWGSHLFYAIDYDAGFETSDDVPMDLRQTIAKRAAVDLLDIIGDGLMSGFSSSSLSMDGLSESFSSTQSATSAYFGARVKEYKDDIDKYIKENRHKFGSMNIGAL